MNEFSFRRDWLSRPIFRWAQHALPNLSDTEREAIEAGDVWWDADLFSGNPDWAKLLAVPPAALSPEEQAFLDGPVEQLCGMLDDWQLTWELGDLPPDVWEFLKTRKFFAMIIPMRILRSYASSRPGRSHWPSPPWCQIHLVPANCCCSSAPTRSAIIGCRDWLPVPRSPASA
jgi:hypothetical protein